MSQNCHSLGKRKQDLFVTIVIAEGMLVLVALGLAGMGLYDRNQPLRLDWLREKWTLSILWGVIATIPSIVFLFSMPYILLRSVRELAYLVKTQLVPMFAGMSVWKLLIIAVVAGIGEELLFRWALQGGLDCVIGEPFGRWIALLVVSLVFGVCHYLSTAYAMIATGIGFYLGLLMILTGSWLAPAVTHTLYDFAAFLFLTDRLPIKFSQEF